MRSATGMNSTAGTSRRSGVPAYEGFEPDDALAIGLEQWLEVELEMTVGRSAT